MHGIINIVVGAGSKPARMPAQIPIAQMDINDNDRNKKMADFNEAGLEPAPTTELKELILFNPENKSGLFVSEGAFGIFVFALDHHRTHAF